MDPIKGATIQPLTIVPLGCTLNVGVIIRTRGERTTKLCIESVCSTISPCVIENVLPFAAAVRATVLQIASLQADWVLSIDADVILVPDWFNQIRRLITARRAKDCQQLIPMAYNYYTGCRSPVGLRIYNGRLAKIMLKTFDANVKAIYSSKKAESKLNVLMRLPLLYRSDITLGYHGFSQYKKHIAQAFSHRSPAEALSNPRLPKATRRAIHGDTNEEYDALTTSLDTFISDCASVSADFPLSKRMHKHFKGQKEILVRPDWRV